MPRNEKQQCDLTAAIEELGKAAELASLRRQLHEAQEELRQLGDQDPGARRVIGFVA